MICRVQLLGLDGCKHGKWVVAISDDSMIRITFDVATTSEVLASISHNTTAAIDIPVGLSRRPRLCDTTAREFLEARRNTVFYPPCPEACRRASRRKGSYAAHHRAVSALNKKKSTLRVGISRQALGIAPRIWDVNRRLTHADQARIKEAHPEVSFALMNGCGPVGGSKKTAEGKAARLELLASRGVPRFNVTAWRETLASVHGRCAAEDDIIDAAAMLWTAWRVHRGIAVRLPAGKVQRGARGLEMAIWA
jgi:predicted RNase H-like nuclease